ncbi:hypothetical protein NSB24_02560 [Blautia coccoides]|uniref:hypothetical protein n=1 Tax=Blautia producta TaxID=33035 RepID=UPI002149EB5F|nr:hypothetical protein [Blautia coccoides]MCR1985111.1 hypothetical protein [Blautia coccoides]
MDKEFKALTVSVEFPNMYEGQIIDREAVLEKLKMFEMFARSSGMYITDRTYIEYGERGLHFYKWKTLIDYFSGFSCKYLKICFNVQFNVQNILSCEPASGLMPEYARAEEYLNSHLASPARCCNRCGNLVLTDDSGKFVCVHCQKTVNPFYTHYKSDTRKLSRHEYSKLVIETSTYFRLDEETETE